MPNVTVNHVMADGLSNFGPLNVTLRTPQSHYYIFRNGVHLALHHPSLVTLNRFMLLAKLVGRLLAYRIFARPRGSNLRAVSVGLINGTFGRLWGVDL